MTTPVTTNAETTNTQTIVTATDFYPEKTQDNGVPDQSQNDSTKTDSLVDPDKALKADGTPADDKDKSSEADKGQAGDLEIKEPENFILDKARIEDVKSFAKEHELDAETAQKILDRENALVASLKQAEQEQYDQQITAWVSDVKADPEIGGDKFVESCEHARRALTKFGSPSLIKTLNETGYGNNPEVVRLLSRIGREIGQATLKGGNGDPPAKTKSIEDIFYGSTTKT
jgi:hypothetical protein